VPGTYADPEELFAFAEVLGRHGAGVFESASRIGEGDRDRDDIPMTRSEMAWMGEVSRRSGRPVSFGLLQHDSRPDLYAQVIDIMKSDSSTVPRGAEWLFVLKHLERIADYVTNICEQIVYMARGQVIKHTVW